MRDKNRCLYLIFYCFVYTTYCDMLHESTIIATTFIVLEQWNKVDEKMIYSKGCMNWQWQINYLCFHSRESCNLLNNVRYFLDKRWFLKVDLVHLVYLFLKMWWLITIGQTLYILCELYSISIFKSLLLLLIYMWKSIFQFYLELCFGFF